MRGPCLCGALDCEACRPGCNRPVECSECGGTFPAWTMIDGLCEQCADNENEEKEWL